MSEQTLILPPYDEMKKLLESVDNNSERLHRIKNFHPILLESAGLRLTPKGVVRMLLLAIDDYIYTVGTHPLMANVMVKSIPFYLDVLIPNPELRQIAIDHFNRCN